MLNEIMEYSGSEQDNLVKPVYDHGKELKALERTTIWLVVSRQA